MVTQRDVAKLAGVSVRTVSNVVNDYTYVAEETRARVRQALDELGYRPNLLARGLARGRSGLIALVLPLDVPYFYELSEYVVVEAERRGYTILIDRTDGQATRERALVSRTDRSAIFDGIIFSPIGLGGPELRYRTADTPVVLLGEKPVGASLDRVQVDDVAAAEAATSHLIGLGRHRIAAVGQPVKARSQTAQHRTLGYQRALQAAGHEFDPDLVATVTDFHRADGALAMTRLLEARRPPDAVFCYNDLMALGALRTLLSKGYRVPEDVAVAGFDDIEDGRYSTPTLTTVAPDKQQIASQAMDLLIRRLDGDAGPPKTARAGWQLMPRESTSIRSNPGHSL
ncbi:LacI family DNA-binding transcriptional regulator [Jiangella asiatica]|uniref:LacI family transcriptional regulator n=1 Tax=Jiangella asiatica TaxID=2530372 RepID=A0A4R5DF65_9ACTN|nr:LacI family DNA-binding transcriptional regulator [Jiangella asiatica]TDE09275.1 LacI family transcriptional regulator [Jiangella asiatica]